MTRLLTSYEDAVGWLFAWRTHSHIDEVDVKVIPRERGRTVVFQHGKRVAVIHPVTVRMADEPWT